LCGVVVSESSYGSDSIHFSYQVLPVESPGNSDFTVSGDSVKFTLYYVDFFCDGFDYAFMRDSSKLIVRRVSREFDNCSKDEERIYGIEGLLTNVLKGKYFFELHTGTSDSTIEPMFREFVKVK
jgi:hypothetical protein